MSSDFPAGLADYAGDPRPATAGDESRVDHDPATSPESSFDQQIEPVEGLDDFATYLDTDPNDEALDVPRRPHHVTTVVIAHNGSRWLKATLLALGRLPYRPDRIVAVDTGSIDDTAEILLRAQADGVIDEVVSADAALGFGAAVALGVECAGRPDEIGRAHV